MCSWDTRQHNRLTLQKSILNISHAVCSCRLQEQRLCCSCPLRVAVALPKGIDCFFRSDLAMYMRFSIWVAPISKVFPCGDSRKGHVGFCVFHLTQVGSKIAEFRHPQFLVVDCSLCRVTV